MTAAVTVTPASSTPLTIMTTAGGHHHVETVSGDSDLDTETDPPDWRLSISQEVLATLSKKETKRQDVINELFHTERSHVRNLKVLDRLFYRPLLKEITHGLTTRDLVDRLFPNLDEVLAWHTKCNQKMKDQVKQKGFPVGNIGGILSEMVKSRLVFCWNCVKFLSFSSSRERTATNSSRSPRRSPRTKSSPSRS